MESQPTITGNDLSLQPDANNAEAYQPRTAEKVGLIDQSSDNNGSSDNPSPEISKPSPHKRSVLADWWITELVGLLAAAALLAAIIAVLKHYDGHPAPNWKHVSLNALISVLSTTSSICVLTPVTSGIGQLKWLWFANSKTGRKLSDFEDFDAASRDFTGSGWLIWKTKGRNFVLFACIAMILVLGWDPFIQNLVQYFNKETVSHSPTDRAYVTNATVYGTTGAQIAVGQQFNTFYVDPVLKANVYSSLFNSGKNRQQWATPQFVCTTGNCTWDPVTTLEMQVLCSDLSSRVNVSCHHINGFVAGVNNCTAILDGLPDFPFLYFSNDVGNQVPMNISASNSNSQTQLQPVIYKNSTMSLVQSIIALDSAPPPPTHDGKLAQPVVVLPNSTFVATECSLQSCARRFKPSVHNSAYSEETLDTWCNAEISNLADTPRQILRPPWAPGQNFTIDDDAVRSLGSFLIQIVAGIVNSAPPSYAYVPSLNPNPSLVPDGSTFASYATPDVLEAIFAGNFSGCDSGPVTCAMENIAQAVSKSIRDDPLLSNGLANANVSIGQVMTSTTFIHIEWQWITLPVVVWFLGFITWIGTAWMTRRADVGRWSNSPLVLMFLERSYLSDRTSSGMSQKDLMQRAKDLKVRLQVQDEQARLVDGG
ncbi:hypothetical protein NA57DRAFT_79137 [Rhizodiscina lignyota]|uniref:DUF3176 domain containing protein n=1 Tax=Rhizodiscina lignyota TaxID=1504668 RepID=A0A9P4M376_9PEZI|nr:hypothetical protein NA57DRAFT_79137 [Rhizodiscina lignyota]